MLYDRVMRNIQKYMNTKHTKLKAHEFIHKRGESRKAEKFFRKFTFRVPGLGSHLRVEPESRVSGPTYEMGPGSWILGVGSYFLEMSITWYLYNLFKLQLQSLQPLARDILSNFIHYYDSLHKPYISNCRPNCADAYRP